MICYYGNDNDPVSSNGNPWKYLSLVAEPEFASEPPVSKIHQHLVSGEFQHRCGVSIYIIIIVIIIR